MPHYPRDILEIIGEYMEPWQEAAILNIDGWSDLDEFRGVSLTYSQIWDCIKNRKMMGLFDVFHQF